ncbi:hypothetical protein DL764_002825 [Monosporascus ibericus]|uniref:Uncharacterized protein n=1 Tax=Monosporascus ibericus TaxID=155417 RepID=A0A4Q4TKS3_9PEZI|nr:hypothetical protein DL764_002825 [Monosporascus ibericus]
MSSDGTNNSQPNGSANRRGSVTSVAFSSLFQRNNSTSAGSGQARDSAAVAAARDQRRRLSITTLGLSGTSPPSTTSQFGLRRGSVSTTTSDSIDENAVDDEETAKTLPNTPYTRHLSFGTSAIRTMRPSPTSPGLNGRHTSGGSPRVPSSASTASAAPLATPARTTSMSHQASNAQPTRTPSDLLSARSDSTYNWSEQLRSRAESTVAGSRHGLGASASSSPPRGNAHHNRTKSVSDMPAPPQQAAAVKPKQPERPKPDHFQERILKGDFYMD